MNLEEIQLDKIANTFLQDVEFLIEAYEFTINGTRTFLEVASDDQLLHHVTIEYSMWAYCQFDKNKEKYYEYLNKYFKDRKPSGNTLFGWDSPSNDKPNEEADRILDRVDLALNFFKTKFEMELPYELKGQDRNKKHSIRNGDWKQDKLLKRVKSFAKSTSDLFSIDKNLIKS
jgi:hypothetical protein